MAKMNVPNPPKSAGNPQSKGNAPRGLSGPAAGEAKKVMSVKSALAQALNLYNQRRLPAAANLTAQIVASRPRLAEAHNLMGAIFVAQGKLNEAAKAFGRATRLAPKNAQYFSNLGEVERQRGKLVEAGIALRQALEIDPDNAQALNNLGIVHFDKREFEEAVGFYQRAISKSAQYAEAQNNLGNALRALNRNDEALEHYQKALLTRENYPEAYNNLASILRDRDQVAEAEHAYRKAISLRPGYLEAYDNLALLLNGLNRSDEALRVLGDALKVNSKHAPTLIQVARIQLEKGNHAQAEQAAKLAIQYDPESAESYAVYGQLLHETDRFEEALVQFDMALAKKPDLVEANSMRGICLKSMGRLDEARDQLSKTLAHHPEAYGVYANMGDLVKFEKDSPYLKSMERILAEATDPTTKRYMPLHFALGKAYDDIGEYEKAIKHFKLGASLKRATLDYNEKDIFAFFDSIKKAFGPTYFANPPFKGNPSHLPVFIIGMPRSGSTLVEQILSSHPQTFGAGEIKEFSRQLNSLRSRFPSLPKYPQIVEKMSEAHFSMVADGYLAKLRENAPGAARITDKLLTNYFFVGFLYTLFPNAKFIHTKRNPVDTCLSAFTKLFKDDMPHSYDLGELGRYYLKYEELMLHWQEMLPPTALKTFVYEDVVDDLPKMARELIDFVGLPWDDACLSFHESSRAVKTASVVQVRQPIYKSSVGRWKRYGDELKPLIEALSYRE